MILEAALVLALIILLWGFARTPATEDEKPEARPVVIPIRPSRGRRSAVPISVYGHDPVLTLD